MNSKEINRVVFYSKQDMSSGINLKNAYLLLSGINLESNFEINDLLELYHIKLYFDNDLFLLDWDENTKKELVDISKKCFTLIKDFWLKIDNDTIEQYVGILEFNYRESFWSLIQYFQVYKKIDGLVFYSILNKFPYQISEVLVLENVVGHFKKEIRTFLIDYNDTAELLLTTFEQERSHSKRHYFFPKLLTLDDREGIISRYLDADNANLNYVELIEKSKVSNELRLSGKIKLKAKRKSLQLKKQIFDEASSFNVGVKVILCKDQTESVKYSNIDYFLEVSYSEKYLNEQSDNIALFNLFKDIFVFTDEIGFISLVNKVVEYDVFEMIQMKSKNEYSIGFVFNRKDILSLSQTIIFNDYLVRERNNSVEKLILSFINEQLSFYLGSEKLQFRLPSESSSYLEKIRVLAPDFEFLLKQYQAYVNDGEIDFELLQLDSTPLNYSTIRSLVCNKYVYINDNQIRYLAYCFFSNQSMLHYIEPFNEKYQNLYDLLVQEDVKLESFMDNYQGRDISKLIEEEYLFVDVNGYVKIKKGIMISLIGKLHEAEVISYWHYPPIVREVIDQMIEDNLLRYENTLFTRQELSYFNFYLNQKEFTNGPDLRNKYLHGTNPNSEEEHKRDYFILLRLIVLALLKIDDDLFLRKQLEC